MVDINISGILSKLAKSKKAEKSESDDDGDLQRAAEEVLSAIEDKDAEALSVSLSAFLELCK